MPDFTLAGLLQDATRRLTDTLGDDGTRAQEASILLSSATCFDRSQMLVRGEDIVTADVKTQFEIFLQRRIAGEPVYRILGEREFHGLRFKLSPDTLEPRDDTETVIDLVLENFPDRKADLRFADLGTGSGAIAIALLSELPHAQALASDLSEGALETAKANAELNGVADRFETCVGSWCDPLEDQFDFLVSNPPYISTSVVERLSREVLDHDPRLALDGGSDGLDAYRQILKTGASHLIKHGFLVLEIGFDQAESVGQLARNLGWLHRETRQDLAGRDRALLLFRE